MELSVNGNSRIGGGIAAAVGLVLVAWGGLSIREEKRRDPNAFSYTGKVVERDSERKMSSFINSDRNRSGSRRRRERNYYLTVAWTVDEREYREQFSIDTRSFYNAHGVGSEVKLAPDGLDPADAELIQPRSWSTMLGLIAFGVLLMAFGGYGAVRGDADLRRLLQRRYA